jgi:ubiquinone/menaquinone biosynthesis C-methylase UbiE
MLQFATRRYPGLSFLQASAEALPFSDRSFDAVAFITSLEFMARPAAALCEARRVARKAILLGILNRFSLYSLYRRFRKRPPYGEAHIYSFSELKRLLRCCLSPPFRLTWRTAALSPRFGYTSSHFPQGGFIAVRVDLAGP